MDRLIVPISIVGMLFLGFLLCIGSIAGIVQLAFMTLIFLLRRPLRSGLRSVSERNFVLVVVFGIIFGLIEEVLWYVFDPSTYWVNLVVDLMSMFPIYFILYVVVYYLAKRYNVTQKMAFLGGGVFGYVFYFIAESGLFGFQIGGIVGASIVLVLIWEVNNFFLNGLLVWFPLYMSDLLIDTDSVEESTTTDTLGTQATC